MEIGQIMDAVRSALPAGWAIRGSRPRPPQLILTLRGPGSRIDLALSARDSGLPAYTSTKKFDLAYLVARNASLNGDARAVLGLVVDAIRAGETSWEGDLELQGQRACLAPGLQDEPVSLDTVWVATTNTCLWACRDCVYHSPLIGRKRGVFARQRFMDPEMFRGIVDGMCELRVPKLRMGFCEEPLRHPRLVEFVETARSAGVPEVDITTTGQKLTPDMVRALVDAGMTTIRVSLNSTDGSNYSLLRYGSFKAALSGLSHVLPHSRRAGGRVEVMVSLVLSPENKSMADEFTRTWLGRADGVILYSVAQYDGKMRTLAFPHSDRTVPPRGPCQALFHEVHVMPDGALFPCENRIAVSCRGHGEPLGHLARQTLPEWWFSRGIERMRRLHLAGRFAAFQLCGNCLTWAQYVVTRSRRDGETYEENLSCTVVRDARARS